MNKAPKAEVLASLKTSGIIAVIRTENPRDLGLVSRALGEGGVLFVEVTMTTPGALAIIGELVSQLRNTNLHIGAGTVLDVATAKAVIEAGAHFIVGPGYDPEITKLCNTRDVLTIAGALTPQEVISAWKGGADVVKIFPADLGGPEYLKAIREPLPQVEMISTKGIDLNTAPSYLKAGAIAVGVGGALMTKAMIANKDYTSITRNAAQFSHVVREAKANQ